MPSEFIGTRYFEECQVIDVSSMIIGSPNPPQSTFNSNGVDALEDGLVLIREES